MRIFSYILLGIVTIFVVNIVISFTVPSYRENLIHLRGKIVGEKIRMPSYEDEKIPQPSTIQTGSVLLVKTGATVMKDGTGTTGVMPIQTGSIAT